MIDFTTDWEKMRDYFQISKEEFLASYSYVTEAEYDATAKIVKDSGKEIKNTWAWFYGNECDFLWKHFDMSKRNSNDRMKIQFVSFEEASGWQETVEEKIND